MNRTEVITSLCEVASKVGSKVFQDNYAHDCFCSDPRANNYKDFRFETPVMDFIIEAVNEKIEREKN